MGKCCQFVNSVLLDIYLSSCFFIFLFSIVSSDSPLSVKWIRSARVSRERYVWASCQMLETRDEWNCCYQDFEKPSVVCAARSNRGNGTMVAGNRSVGSTLGFHRSASWAICRRKTQRNATLWGRSSASSIRITRALCLKCWSRIFTISWSKINSTRWSWSTFGLSCSRYGLF